MRCVCVFQAAATLKRNYIVSSPLTEINSTDYTCVSLCPTWRDVFPSPHHTQPTPPPALRDLLEQSVGDDLIYSRLPLAHSLLIPFFLPSRQPPNENKMTTSCKTQLGRHRSFSLRGRQWRDHWKYFEFTFACLCVCDFVMGSQLANDS